MADGARRAADDVVTLLATAAPSPAAVGELRERVRAAAAPGTPLRIVGRGTWLDAGRPVQADDRLELGALRGVTEYTPGDLTLTARAGTSLGEIAAITQRERQWLALDPVGGAEGSLGATIATASAGPASHAFGLVRDNVLGVEFVTGSGDLVRAGGRVVKNVAGFDLSRLVTGAWGTLGAITEVTVRLRALPAADETVMMPLAGDAPSLGRQLRAVRDAPLAPYALELASDVLAARCGAGSRAVMLARLAGNDELVRAQRATLAALGDVAPAPGDCWTRLATPDPLEASVVRLSAAPSRLPEVWALASALARDTGGWAQATVGRGAARVVMQAAAADALRAALAPVRRAAVRVVFERLPASLWPDLAPSAANDRLSRGVRRAFDPRHILNPGILGEDTA